jgi:hypothetical protein
MVFSIVDAAESKKNSLQITIHHTTSNAAKPNILLLANDGHKLLGRLQLSIAQ